MAFAFTREGGLIAYGTDLAVTFRRAVELWPRTMASRTCRILAVHFKQADECADGGAGVEFEICIWWNMKMNEFEKLAERIEKLSPEELKKFRAWFAEFDAKVWDAQIKADSKAGRLDGLVAEGLAEYKAGKTREL